MRKRIFLAIGGKVTPADTIHIWVKNLYEPLVALGYDVFLWDIDEVASSNKLAYMSDDAKEFISEQLPLIFEREHAKKKFDFFFSYFHNQQITPNVLSYIKEQVFVINYSTNFHQFEMYREIASIADFNIFISKDAESSFKQLNKPYYWLPLAANPAFYKIEKFEKKKNQAIFIGSVYGARAALFWRLLQYGVNIQLYGQGWLGSSVQKKENRSAVNRIKIYLYRLINKAVIKKAKAEKSTEVEINEAFDVLNRNILNDLRLKYAQNLNTPLNDGDFVSVMSSSTIVVNIAESRFNHNFYDHRVLFASNLRDFEAVMCGAMVITQHSEEIALLFEVGKEIITYHNEHDLANKLKYYLENPLETSKIAEAGYKRVVQFHTWETRFKDLFAYVDKLQENC